jgi:hypothetical protein
MFSTVTSQKPVRCQVMTILFKSQSEHEQAKIKQATNRLKPTVNLHQVTPAN